MIDKILVYFGLCDRVGCIFWLSKHWKDAGTLDLDAGLTLDSLSDKNYALNTIVTPLSEARGPYRQGGGNFSQTLY